MVHMAQQDRLCGHAVRFLHPGRDIRAIFGGVMPFWGAPASPVPSWWPGAQKSCQGPYAPDGECPQEEPGLPGASGEGQYGDCHAYEDAGAARSGSVMFHCLLPSFLCDSPQAVYLPVRADKGVSGACAGSCCPVIIRKKNRTSLSVSS